MPTFWCVPIRECFMRYLVILCCILGPHLGAAHAQEDLENKFRLATEKNHNFHDREFALDAKCVCFADKGRPSDTVADYDKTALTQPVRLFKIWVKPGYLVAESELLVVVATPYRSFVLGRSTGDARFSI